MASAQIHTYEDGTHRPKWMAHLVLATRDKKRLAGWYAKVFGTKNFLNDGPILFTSFDQEHHRIAFVEMANAVPPDGRQHVGMMHVAFSYGAYALKELLETWERLKADGIEPRAAVNHGTTCSLYYIDPDGNEIELMSENFASIQEANEWYAKGLFDKNMFGKNIDPQDLLDRLRAGEPAKDLQYPARTAADWPPMGEVAPRALNNRHNAIRKVVEQNGWLGGTGSPSSAEPANATTAHDIVSILRSRFAAAADEQFGNCVVFDLGRDGAVSVDGRAAQVEVAEGHIESPDVLVKIALRDLDQLLAGNVEATDLMMDDRIEIDGDLMVMLRMRDILRGTVAEAA